MSEEKIKNKNSQVAKELDKAQEQFDQYDKQIKDLTHDRMNMAPKEEVEAQTKLSSREIADAKDVYLKPRRTISCADKFNEKYRDDYNYKKEFVQFIAEHRELIGSTIEMWTKPFAGVPAEFWEVPTNKPVWGPRYLAERIAECSYHRLKTEDQIVGHNSVGSMTGNLIVDTTVQRLVATPVSKRKSIFMGANSF
jgi:hypothetical protein